MEDERKYQVYMHISPEGKRYIGASKEGYKTRWAKNKYHDSVFGDACQKFGWENMQHVVLFEGLTFEEAHDLEEAMIAKYDTMNPAKGYNRDRGALYRSPAKPRPVICLDTGIVYPSCRQAGVQMKLNDRNILLVCKGRNQTVKGYHFKYFDEEESND